MTENSGVAFGLFIFIYGFAVAPIFSNFYNMLFAQPKGLFPKARCDKFNDRRG